MLVHFSTTIHCTNNSAPELYEFEFHDKFVATYFYSMKIDKNSVDKWTGRY